MLKTFYIIVLILQDRCYIGYVL